MTDEFRLVNNDNSTGIKFFYASGVGDNISVSNISIQMPGSSASYNYSRNWGGFKRLITVDFVLHSDGSTDKSTDGSSKITISQQKNHLMDTVIQGNSTGQSNVTYTLTIYEDSGNKTYTGAIDNIDIKWSPSEANILRGSLNLFVGS